MMRHLRLDFVKVRLPPQPAGMRGQPLAVALPVRSSPALKLPILVWSDSNTRGKISFVLIRNTVGPNANRTTPRLRASIGENRSFHE